MKKLGQNAGEASFQSPMWLFFKLKKVQNELTLMTADMATKDEKIMRLEVQLQIKEEQEHRNKKEDDDAGTPPST